MVTTRTLSPLPLLPSLADVAFVLPIVAVACKSAGLSSLIEGDTGWHVRAGEWILRHGQVPTRDLFSFTKPESPWFAWEWLAEVLMALLHRMAGLTGVALGALLVLCCTSVLAYTITARFTENRLLAFAVTALGVGVSHVHWWARPHLATFAFSLIAFSLLEDAWAGNGRRAWWLVPLCALWANLHGGFVFLLMMTAVYALAAALEAWWRDENGLWRRAQALGALLVASAAASLLNPYGAALHRHILSFLGEGYHFEKIAEFLPLPVPGVSGFELLLLSSAAAAFWHGKSGNWRHGLLLLLLIHLALIARRNIAVLGVLSPPMMAAAAGGWMAHAGRANWPESRRRALEGLLEECAAFSRMDAKPRWHAAAALLFLAVARTALGEAPPEQWTAQFQKRLYPVDLLERFQFTARARIFTHDEWGDFLIYRLYPGTRVFVDGRSDFYGPAFCEEYSAAYEAKPAWSATLAAHGINAVLLPPDTGLASALKLSAGWRVLYDDGAAILFVRPPLVSGEGAAVVRERQGVVGFRRRSRSSEALPRSRKRLPDDAFSGAGYCGPQPGNQKIRRKTCLG